jgi:hypothetical protein
MDDFSKKLFAQLGDTTEAVREKALDALVKHLSNPEQWFPDALLKIEQGSEAQRKYVELDIKYQEALQHNAQWTQRDQAMQQQVVRLQQEIAVLKRRVAVQASLAWLRFNWMKVAVGAALLVAAPFGYQQFFAEAWPEAADAGLRSLARATVWGEGFERPFVATVAGKPMWVLLRGEINTSAFADAKAHAVVMHCVHVFAAPAEPNSGQYRSVDPYWFFGWLRWPERVVHCQPSPNPKEAQR